MSTDTQTTNIICYVEIPANDPEKAAAFYKSVFGWKTKPSSLTDLNYWLFETNEGGIAGGIDGSKQVNENGIAIYVKVSDIEQTLLQVEKAGGSVACAKEDIGGGYGYSATFKDNQGNIIGLWSDK